MRQDQDPDAALVQHGRDGAVLGAEAGRIGPYPEVVAIRGGVDHVPSVRQGSVLILVISKYY